MEVFYGGAIQGAKNRKERVNVHKILIEIIKESGFQVATEHTTSTSLEEAIKILEKTIGPIPKEGIGRRRYVRNKMIEAVEGDIAAAIFEVSTPSLGTGVELAHAYLRPRMGLKTVPVLALYEKDYWPNKLSTMVIGINPKTVPHFTLKEYTSLEDAKRQIKEFLSTITEVKEGQDIY